MTVLPAQIGKYEIVRLLGKGAMGMVFEGRDPVIQRRVAIKRVLREFFENTDELEAAARFRREAQASGRLHHPNIVSIYEYGEEAAGAYIVMEYVEGKELRHHFRERRAFTPIEVFGLIRQLLAALSYSHKQGVVHRDIKPANLMLRDDHSVKVMDFGIARIGNESLTVAGTVMGTPTHMAPEQIAGQQADARADLWSAGVILYELLTGANPFASDSPASIMHKVSNGDFIPPSRRVAGLSVAFDALLAKALAKSADERFHNAEAFYTALVAAFQGKSPVVAAAKPTPSAPAAPLVAPETARAIELALSRHIGPIAAHLTERTLGSAGDMQALQSALCAQIDDESERQEFAVQLRIILDRNPAAAAPVQSKAQKTGARRPDTPVAFSAQSLEMAEERLAHYVGPFAKVLIKEAADKSGNLRELYANLAHHIDSESERRDFLALLNGGAVKR